MNIASRLLIGALALVGSAATCVAAGFENTAEWNSGNLPSPVNAKHVFMSVGSGKSINFGTSNISAENAQRHACLTYDSSLDENQRGCAAPNRPAACPSILAFNVEQAEQCHAKENSLVCGSGFASGFQAYFTDRQGKAAAGISCGKKTQQEADKAAMASCEKARQKAGGNSAPCQAQ